MEVCAFSPVPARNARTGRHRRTGCRQAFAWFAAGSGKVALSRSRPPALIRVLVRRVTPAVRRQECDNRERNMEKLHRINEVAWDKVAAKYEPDIEQDAMLLQSGGTSLLDCENRILGDLSKWCERAVHLQCSHGLDALSLWKLGAREVIGIDISSAMLTLARHKAELL